MSIEIKEIGYYLPNNTESGLDLAAEHPEWRIADIEKKTGIKNRHIARGENAVDMGVYASEEIFKYGYLKDEIDLLILVTQSPIYILPSSSCVLHERLGLKKSCMAFDINLGCSGFVYALSVCHGLLESGIATNCLIVCSDMYSQYIGKSDRTCRPIFSDGAGAALISKNSSGEMGPFEMGTDGSGFDKLIVKEKCDAGTDGQKVLHMDGGAVYLFTMDTIPKCIKRLLAKANKEMSEIDLIILHQASKLVVDGLIMRMEWSKEKVFVNYDKIGNTVSASIPIAMKQAVEEGRLSKGDNVMLIGFGVGLSWGACILKY